MQFPDSHYRHLEGRSQREGIAIPDVIRQLVYQDMKQQAAA